MAIFNDVQPKGMHSYYTKAPFNKGKVELEKAGYSIISLEQNARLRMQEGKDSYVSQNGNWVREGFVYIPDKFKFLTKNSPLITYPTNGRNVDLIEKYLLSSLNNSLHLRDGNFSVPTDRFGEEDITSYAFGNSARDYGEFLRDAGITEMPVKITVGNKPFVGQAWFGGLSDKSSLILGGILNSNYKIVRAVFEDDITSKKLEKLVRV
jgi:hypothetical protein